MRGPVLKAGDLLILRCQVPDRVEDEVRERERRVDCGRGEVADGDPDLLSARLRAQLRDHRSRQVDPMHAHATVRERDRDPASANAELERTTMSRQFGEKVDDRFDDPRLEHVAASSSYRSATCSPKWSLGIEPPFQVSAE